MKKFTYIVIALVAVGYMGFTAIPAQAASLPAAQVLGSGNASALKQTLDVLQTLLDLMKIRIADTEHPLTEGQKAALHNVLGGMRASLVGVSGTVASLEQKALAMESAKTLPVAAVSQVPGEAAPSGAENAPADGQVAGLSVTDWQADKAGSESETAAVGNAFGRKGLLWGALVIIVLIAGGIVFFRATGGKGEEVSAPAEEAKLPFAETQEPPSAGATAEREEAPVF